MTNKPLFGLLAGSFLLFTPRTFGAAYVASTVADITADIGKMTPGDTILVRAGTYTTTATISITASGTSSKPCCLMVNKGDARPVLDFSGMPAGGSNRGMLLKGSYWHIAGIIIKGAGDNGMNISGNNNIVEFCDFAENQDAGCQLGGGASNNRIINCDSYYNKDPGQGNADGFSPKLDVGTGNYFSGCRSWQNSDDGYDGYLRPSDDITTTFENCWCFKNGYLKDGSASSGNGNGFKMGGSDNKDLRHNQILKNCLSVGNRVKGFDQNNNIGSMTLYNCTAFNNGTNYKIDGTILASGKSLTVENCISAGTGGVSLTGGAIITCSWSSGFSVSTTDFVSVDPASLTAQRKTDGSLPDITFMHLASGSKLIDAGTIVNGMPYNGTKPDLGCFETGMTPARVAAWTKTTPSFSVIPAFSQGRMRIIFPLLNGGSGTLSLLDLSGKTVIYLGTGQFASGTNERWVNVGGLGPGTYVWTVRTQEFSANRIFSR